MGGGHAVLREDAHDLPGLTAAFSEVAMVERRHRESRPMEVAREAIGPGLRGHSRAW
jgi:hypothetical protein